MEAVVDDTHKQLQYTKNTRNNSLTSSKSFLSKNNNFKVLLSFYSNEL